MRLLLVRFYFSEKCQKYFLAEEDIAVWFKMYFSNFKNNDQNKLENSLKIEFIVVFSIINSKIFRYCAMFPPFKL